MNADKQATDPFQSIRPYRDSEVEAVLQRLIRDDECISALTRYQFPRAFGPLGWLLKPMVRIAVAARVGDIENVNGFQMMVANYMQKMISRTTTRVSCSGLERLEAGESYLFVSNHRDIAMDPAFVNWVRYQGGMSTVRIAIGDNLLSKPYVSDLMRLNKSFIVNRSAKGREMMTALTQLSAYIDHSVVEGNSVWIAQREGRAKDGNDRTDAALMKMLYMSHRKQRSLNEMVARLNIVPVSISYEWDPCDALKAQELAAVAMNGSYEKSEFEDINSIVRGITGDKGAVHVAFGTPLEGEFETPEQLAAEIDRQIHLNYRLHPTNLAAAGEAVSDSQQQAFEARLAEVDVEARPFLQQMYANPVLNQKQAEQELS
ncbi:1-acyl-sn-glycerol-3-phosphate acyltransferase [Marinobacterium marinum]|uniref:1-acyl-sn-glycerol-3-phosphate acyltransferase n=1 Tax=Marinobacterium marinum TaxID=2756129 RepID=A0A7W2AB57_9GAMM|nr:1-acyl-sn-glycerol-3-phosphate acyltransferase [Marinobacterium marinum]MBA4501132.1 1-acyl-sn-glycerol-3-phosphate acyltransferase [Marinobacterium marinum]